MKKIISILFLLLAGTALFADTVSWYTSYDKALAAAKKENKNIFLLITAPSWCGWCVKLEENVLSKSDVQQAISKDYIPLKLLDEINGVRNPELSNFNFSGYPTVRIYSKDGNFVQDIYSQDKNKMLASLDSYKNPAISSNQAKPEKFIAYPNSNGDKWEFESSGDGFWSLTVGEDEEVLMEFESDNDFIYLMDGSGMYAIALPLKGSDGGLGRVGDDGVDWTVLAGFEKVE